MVSCQKRGDVQRWHPGRLARKYRRTLTCLAYRLRELGRGNCQLASFCTFRGSFAGDVRRRPRPPPGLAREAREGVYTQIRSWYPRYLLLFLQIALLWSRRCANIELSVLLSTTLIWHQLSIRVTFSSTSECQGEFFCRTRVHGASHTGPAKLHSDMPASSSCSKFIKIAEVCRNYIWSLYVPLTPIQVLFQGCSKSWR